MQLNPYIVLGSAVVGLLVGLTGAGGGALMTPMLILLFGIKPSSAISSDLVAAVLMRPVSLRVPRSTRLMFVPPEFATSRKEPLLSIAMPHGCAPTETGGSWEIVAP